MPISGGVSREALRSNISTNLQKRPSPSTQRASPGEYPSNQLEKIIPLPTHSASQESPRARSRPLPRTAASRISTAPFPAYQDPIDTVVLADSDSPTEKYEYEESIIRRRFVLESNSAQLGTTENLSSRGLQDSQPSLPPSEHLAIGPGSVNTESRSTFATVIDVLRDKYLESLVKKAYTDFKTTPVTNATMDFFL